MFPTNFRKSEKVVGLCLESERNKIRVRVYEEKDEGILVHWTKKLVLTLRQISGG